MADHCVAIGLPRFVRGLVRLDDPETPPNPLTEHHFKVKADNNTQVDLCQ